MPEKRDMENRGGDWRWLILALAAFLCAYLLSARRLIDLCFKDGKVLVSRSWVDYDLNWRADGPDGPGIYLNGQREGEDEWGAALPGGRGRQYIEPRLAIFTFSPVDLNQADAEVLQTIKGIGPRLAGAIVDYRESNGSFRSVDELLRVRGIGPIKLAGFRQQLSVDPENRQGSR